MKSWRELQKESFSKLSELLDYLELDENNRARVDMSPHFPLLLPQRLAEKIPKNELDHPIARQFIPLKLEKIDQAGFTTDPLCEEQNFRKTPAALHKYPGRVLLVTSGACVMHCRYCFRQNFSYDSQDKTFEKEIAYIKNDSTIHEVILSGGDPLSLSDEVLGALMEKIDAIDHVKIIRFHTRFPIGIPERISPEFLDRLKKLKCQITFIIHTNCVEELDRDVISAMKDIMKIGAPVLTQSVLTRGVNNSFDALRSLFLKCITNGMIPYYLHQMDRVKGAAHFEVNDIDGQELINQLRACLPGYAIPTLVREVPHKQSKTPLQILGQ